MVYSIIVKPSNNIAFFDTYLKMCEVELANVLGSLNVLISDVEVKKMNKATVMNFSVEVPIDGDVLVAIYRLSFFYALLKLNDNGTYKPVHIDYEADFDDDLSTRMKYNGKTNETITRMMMNLALSASIFMDVEKPNILDPLCGRGTTLFEAMISGYNAFGVDRDQKSVQELGTFVTRYVKEARFKHQNKHGKLLLGGKHVGDLFELEYAKEKADYKSGNTNLLKVLKGNTTAIEGAFRHKFMHAIVADFPYNVQHRGKSSASIEDGLSPLLDEGLKSWTPFLKKGGAVAISWNVYTDKREAFEKVFEKHGYQVVSDLGLDQLEHRVSQAITRDIIIAVKS